MKKFIVLFFVFLCFAFRNSTSNSFPLFGKVIAIDVGHGSYDSGSIYKSNYEKDYNLLFSKSLSDVLEKHGATVLVVRDADYDLSSPNTNFRKRSDFDNRIKLIDGSNADMYLSLHMNYFNNSKYYGAQVFYSEVNSQNKFIAEALQNNFNNFFNFNKESKKIGNDKYLYSKLKTRGVLIEYGFISNETDRNNIIKDDYRRDLSIVICNSIVEYFT